MKNISYISQSDSGESWGRGKILQYFSSNMLKAGLQKEEFVVSMMIMHIMHAFRIMIGF